MKKSILINEVILPDRDESDWETKTFAEVHVRTFGHGRLPPMFVTFPNGASGSVRQHTGDHITVILDAEKCAAQIEELTAICESDDPEVVANIRYR